MRDPADPAVSDPADPASGEPALLLAAYGAALAEAVADVLGGWVLRSVEGRWQDFHGSAAAEPSLRAAAEGAGAAAVAEVLPVLCRLLQAGLDQQWTGPLALLRGAVRYPTEVLRGAGVPPVVRDDFAQRNFPDDDYDLTPASFADIDPALHEPGLLWGAAKAHAALRRHRASS